MDNFKITITTVMIMFLYAIPGFLLMKFKKVESSHIKTVSTILVYVFGPCMILDSFLSVERNKETIINMIIFALATIVIQIAAIVILYFIFKKKYDDAKYRMLTVGSVCGNNGFFGLPIIRAVLSDYPIAQTYSSIFVFTMNAIVFTVGSFCITREKKYISFKQAFLNPTSVALIVSIILFSFGFSFDFQKDIGSAVSLLGKMTTPVCMIVLGMRLACIKFRDLFNKPIVYLTAALKLIFFPLLAYLCVYFLPVDNVFKASMLILSSVPTAAVVLNLAEMYDANQEIAANIVMITTLFSIITIPIVLLIL